MTTSIEQTHSANWVLMPTTATGAQLAKARSRGYGLEEAKALYRDLLAAAPQAPSGTVPCNEVLSLREQVARLKAQLADVCTRGAEMANKAADEIDRLSVSDKQDPSDKPFGWFIDYPRQLPTISMISAPEFSRDRRAAEHLAGQCAQICGYAATLHPLYLEPSSRAPNSAEEAVAISTERLYWILEHISVDRRGISMPCGNSKAAPADQSIAAIDEALEARRSALGRRS